MNEVISILINLFFVCALFIFIFIIRNTNKSWRNNINKYNGEVAFRNFKDFVESTPKFYK